MTAEDSGEVPAQDIPATPTWTYPTRFCRICREDVVPTITMYPPGVPPRFQRAIVEYKNDDEYGRLIKPCKCAGSMRYIHELCLQRSRTENRREDSMWKCHTCGYKFNFQRLAIDKFLSSRFSSGVLTMVTMVVIMFFLGFVADPIINLYVDPYETLLGDQELWDEVRMRAPGSNFVSRWMQHFMKGLVSMGLVGFIKTILLNPLNWLNLRHNLGMTSARTTNTGRDRAINISWVAVLIGVVSAFYFFYQWVQTVIGLALKKVGNNIVDTQLPGDDDDLKPPPGWKREQNQEPNPGEPDSVNSHTYTNPADEVFAKAAEVKLHADPNVAGTVNQEREDEITIDSTSDRLGNSPILVPSFSSTASTNIGRSSALDSAHDQGWSFASL